MKSCLFWMVFVLLLISTSCRKNDNIIPFVNVNININLDLPQYQSLLVPTGWEYVTGGSRGIIVYRQNNDEFSAYDRHSTFNVSEGCRVFIEDDNFTLKDECSDSKWSVIDGTVLEGPATASLGRYNTTFNPPFLTISN